MPAERPPERRAKIEVGVRRQTREHTTLPRPRLRLRPLNRGSSVLEPREAAPRVPDAPQNNAASTGAPVTRETTTNPPTPAGAAHETQAGAREAVRAPDDRLHPELAPVRRLARNQSGNGYQAFAKTPINGRPIATDAKYATPHSALRTTGCAR